MVMCVCVLVFVWELSYGLGLKWAFTPLGPLRVLFKGSRTPPKPRKEFVSAVLRVWELSTVVFLVLLEEWEGRGGRTARREGGDFPARHPRARVEEVGRREREGGESDVAYLVSLPLSAWRRACDALLASAVLLGFSPALILPRPLHLTFPLPELSSGREFTRGFYSYSRRRDGGRTHWKVSLEGTVGSKGKTKAGWSCVRGRGSRIRRDKNLPDEVARRKEKGASQPSAWVCDARGRLAHPVSRAHVASADPRLLRVRAWTDSPRGTLGAIGDKFRGAREIYFGRRPSPSACKPFSSGDCLFLSPYLVSLPLVDRPTRLCRDFSSPPCYRDASSRERDFHHAFCVTWWRLWKKTTKRHHWTVTFPLPPLPLRVLSPSPAHARPHGPLLPPLPRIPPPLSLRVLRHLTCTAPSSLAHNLHLSRYPLSSTPPPFSSVPIPAISATRPQPHHRHTLGRPTLSPLPPPSTLPLPLLAISPTLFPRYSLPTPDLCLSLPWLAYRHVPWLAYLPQWFATHLPVRPWVTAILNVTPVRCLLAANSTPAPFLHSSVATNYGGQRIPAPRRPAFGIDASLLAGRLCPRWLSARHDPSGYTAPKVNSVPFIT